MSCRSSAGRSSVQRAGHRLVLLDTCHWPRILSVVAGTRTTSRGSARTQAAVTRPMPLTDVTAGAVADMRGTLVAVHFREAKPKDAG